MAVFTPLEPQDVADWLRDFDLGTLTELQGIASGIENTNYFVTTTAGRFVLTVFERLQFEQLPFYLGLMHHLAQHDIPVPDPMPDRHGQAQRRLKGKPAAMVTRLAGRSVLDPGPEHCAQVGQWLARMHLAAIDYPRRQPNLRGLAWQRQVVPTLMPFLDGAQRDLLQAELAQQIELSQTAAWTLLPRSAVHADLFRDNVLFDGDSLSGIFDFYFAGVDTWIYDLAVALNDWCVHPADGRFDPPRRDALLAAYNAVRPLTPGESALLPLALRAAALRFWVSRLADVHLPRDAALLQPHDPAHFERVLRQRVAESTAGALA